MNPQFFMDSLRSLRESFQKLRPTPKNLGSAPKNEQDWNQTSDVGYSFWMGIAAIIVMAIASIIGFIASFTSKVMPI